MKKTYHIVTRAAKEPAAIIEQFCQANGQILLPLVNLIQSASQVVETILPLSAEQSQVHERPAKQAGRLAGMAHRRAKSNSPIGRSG